MKRKYKMISMAFLIISTLMSCQKYLDIAERSDYVNVKTANDCQLLLDDYSTMNSNYPSDMIMSSDEYFATDAIVSRSEENAAFYRWDKNAIRPLADQQWQTNYKKVFQANLVLETVAKLRKENTTSSTVLDGLEGAALFYRSYCFWALAQMYAQPYKPGSDNSSPGIPLRLTSDLNEVTSRGTVKTTYDQIVSDLQKAVTLMPTQVVIASRPGKGAANAMLSRCYLSMSDYTNALSTATAALAINSTLLDFNTLTSGSRYIKTKFNIEILFQALAYEDYYGLLSSDNVNVNLGLLAQYSANDLRNNVFFKLSSDGFKKFIGSYDASSTLFTGLALDEVYLNRAECYARANNAALAMADLNKLLKNRYVNTTSAPYVDLVASSADDALAKVLTERKKELVLRGLRWTDLRRLNQTASTATTLSRTIAGVTYTLPPNDLRYTLLIPQEVITNSSLAQNAR